MSEGQVSNLALHALEKNPLLRFALNHSNHSGRLAWNGNIHLRSTVQLERRCLFPEIGLNRTTQSNQVIVLTSIPAAIEPNDLTGHNLTGLPFIKEITKGKSLELSVRPRKRMLSAKVVIPIVAKDSKTEN